MKNLERKAPPTKAFLSKREPEEILEDGRELASGKGQASQE